MKFSFVVLLVSITIAGCSFQQTPYKRPMQQAYLDSIKTPVKVSVPESDVGIATTFFAQDSSAAGAQYGLIGALTTAVIDSIANSNPASIAQDGANLIHAKVQRHFLDQQLIDSLKSHQSVSTQTYWDLSNINKVKFPSSKESPIEGIFIDTGYVFNTTGEMLIVIANVTLNVSGVSYKTPYVFEKKIPKEQLSGPLYSNTFTYYSSIAPQLVKNEEEISKQISAINEKYIDKKGKLPKKGTNAEIKMRRELKEAKADYSKKEKYDFTMQHWLENDAKRLKDEINAANVFIASQLMMDLQLMEIPSINGVDAIIKTEADGRRVTRLGTGVYAGQVESTPKDIPPLYRNSLGFGIQFVYPEDEKSEKSKIEEKNKVKKSD